MSTKARRYKRLHRSFSWYLVLPAMAMGRRNGASRLIASPAEFASPEGAVISPISPRTTCLVWWTTSPASTTIAGPAWAAQVTAGGSSAAYPSPSRMRTGG